MGTLSERIEAYLEERGIDIIVRHSVRCIIEEFEEEHEALRTAEALTRGFGYEDNAPTREE